jgi:tRNA-Thr(GGU) m(6)t(6)A37 methyltransferase TsaA
MTKEQIILNPIGVIHSPYKEPGDIPIQGIFKNDVEGWVQLQKKYIKGLRDLDGFSHAILIYYFHKSQKEEIEGKPFLEKKTHGIFAVRSPHRPNHLGFSIVKINEIVENIIYFTGVDMLDGTPLLDIKPYVKYFDSREEVTCGWIEKHFKDGNIPDAAIFPCLSLKS